MLFCEKRQDVERKGCCVCTMGIEYMDSPQNGQCATKTISASKKKKNQKRMDPREHRQEESNYN